MKLMRSTVTWAASLLIGVLIPVLALAFTWLAENGTGAVAAKAQAMIVGEGWTGYLNIAHQTAAAAIFVGAGVVVAWTFGREHADRTFPSLFALPVSKGSIATAKLIVLLVWALVLSTAVSAVAFLVGIAAGLTPLSAAGMWELGRLWAVVFSTCLLATTVALVASVGRGYLPAIGAVVLLVAAAQVSVAFGAGGWFPYAVPGLLAVASTRQIPRPHLLGAGSRPSHGSGSGLAHRSVVEPRRSELRAPGWAGADRKLRRSYVRYWIPNICSTTLVSASPP